MKTLKKLNNPYLPAIIGTVALLILGQCLSKGFLSIPRGAGVPCRSGELYA